MSKQSPSTTKKGTVKKGGALFNGSFLWVFGLTLVLTGGITLGGAFQSLDRALYDLFLRINIQYRPISLDPRIIRVDLNDTSENSLGEDLNSRKSFADLIEVLGDCGSRAAMDFIFKANAPYDSAFHDAVSHMETLILSVTPIPETFANFSHESLSEEERSILAKSVWHIKEHGGGIFRLPARLSCLTPK
jgi:CHASE2 domain-containing sensor protein